MDESFFTKWVRRFLLYLMRFYKYKLPTIKIAKVMRLFISNIDTYLQNHVYESFCKHDKEESFEFFASRLFSPSQDDHFERVAGFVSVRFYISMRFFPFRLFSIYL